MEKDILRRDAIWITEKAKNGATSLYSIADFPNSEKNCHFSTTINKENSVEFQN
jgi:hypothetical protein